MKRVVAVLCALAAVVLLLLLRTAGDRGAAPDAETAPTAGPSGPSSAAPTAATRPPPAAAPSAPASAPAPVPAERGGRVTDWAPRGRVVGRATGEPIYWNGLDYEIRFRISDESPLSWSLERDPPAEGDDPPKDPGAFELGALVGQSAMETHAPPDGIAVAEFRVRAQARGFAKASTDWMRWADFPRDRVLLVEMDAEAPSRLFARVRTGEGAPFRGRARLRLFESGDDGQFQGTDPVDADGDGVLAFEALPPGTFRASIVPEGAEGGGEFHVPGDESAAKEIVLPPGGSAEAGFVLAPAGEISVEVLAADGSAVEAWVLDYTFRRGSGSSGASPRRLTGCPPGEYEVKIWSNGFLEWKATVRVDAGGTALVEARLERAPWGDYLRRVPDEVLAWLDRTAADLARKESLVAARQAILQATRGEVWDRLTAASGFGDRPDMGAEIRLAWRNRKMGAARTTTYGSGTFVMERPPAGAAKAERTPEEWWKDAAADQRKEWLLTWCAEKCGLVEVVEIRDDPGPAGQGAGMIRSISWR